MNTLLELDPAPRTTLTAREAARRDELLASITDDSREAAPRRSARPWIFGAAAVLTLGVAAAAAGAVFVGPRLLESVVPEPAAASALSTADLASWTSAAASATPASALTDWCLSSIGNAGGTPTITNAEQRGSTASMIITRGGFTSLCITGSAGGGFSELLSSPDDTVPTVPADTVSVETAGSHGDGATGFTYAEGPAGADVASITVSDSGKRFAATVEAGRWTAWWPTDDPHGAITGTVTVTLHDGTSRVIQGSDLQP